MVLENRALTTSHQGMAVVVVCFRVLTLALIPRNPHVWAQEKLPFIQLVDGQTVILFGFFRRLRGYAGRPRRITGTLCGIS